MYQSNKIRMHSVLYIDTSQTTITHVAIKKNGRRVEKTVTSDTWRSQMVLPLVRELLKEQNMSPRDIQEIVVNTGPGSFTGLRVGIAVAQMIGILLKIPVNGNVVGRSIDPVYR